VAYTGLLPYTVGTIRIEDVDFDASARTRKPSFMRVRGLVVCAGVAS
jgi:hypothetical protein